MASAVETQRLISVSLGKIARSRSQRGGINLHKNLLVASVLNKARTAFLMENYSHQLSQQQHQKQQVVLSTPQPTPAWASSSPVAESGNSLPTHVAETCPTTPDTETRSAPVDTQASSEPVNGGGSCAQSPSTPTSVDNNVDSEAESVCDKENVSPSSDNSISSSAVSGNSEQLTNESKQQCVSGEQHIEAANQLSHDAQLAGSPTLCQNNTSSYITLSPCKQQSSATTTCAGVLKRRRVNPEAAQISCESECPASKKARVSSSDSDCSSYSQNSLPNQLCDPTPSSCEYDSDNCESDMQTSDSPQISNLVSIFNAGFSGLCNVSQSSPSPSSSSLDYDSSSCYQSGNSDYSSSVSHSHHQSWSSSDNQSLHCSSMVDRIGTISSAIVLSA